MDLLNSEQNRVVLANITEMALNQKRRERNGSDQFRIITILLLISPTCILMTVCMEIKLHFIIFITAFLSIGTFKKYYRYGNGVKESLNLYLFQYLGDYFSSG